MTALEPSSMPRDVYRHWAKTPPGTRVYAIGDMHGRLDLVDKLHALIRTDAGDAPGVRVVVYLGDYVDRGPDSKGLVERLISEPLPLFETVHLKGNHEDLMLEFLEQGGRGAAWLVNGGDATLRSYGVAAPSPYAEEAHPAVRQRLLEEMPARHRGFFDSLRLSYRAGDYLFVHAGVHPAVALDAQDPRDLVWIREPFLESEADFGACVVHGHTIGWAPVIKKNRIGLDTGAYRTGTLSCAVIEGDSVRILQT
jgi:serine/threonine protein phosphatase 1